jgi:hypothetical protein
MTLSSFVDLLGLPPAARIERRVPKTLLLEHGAANAADRRQIQEGIEQLLWVAALKPANVGVLAYRDAVRQYLEIAVLTVTIRPGAKAPRLIERIHRAIPYPVVLWSLETGGVSLSLAHKRWSLGTADEVVAEDMRKTPPLESASTGPTNDFLASLRLTAIAASDLFALYQGWLDRMAALEAAAVTGRFSLPTGPDAATARREALSARGRLQREIAKLRAQAQREKQMARRADLNLAVQRLESELRAADRALQGAVE